MKMSKRLSIQMRQILTRIIVVLVIVSLFACQSSRYTKKDYIKEYDNYFQVNSLDVGLVSDEKLDQNLDQDTLLSSLIKLINYPEQINEKEVYELALQYKLIAENKTYGISDIPDLFLKTKQIKDYREIQNINKNKLKQNIETIKKDQLEERIKNKDCETRKFFLVEENGEYKYIKIEKENEYCAIRDAKFDEIFEDIDMQGEFEIDFSKSEISEMQPFVNKSMNKNGLEEIAFETNGKIASVAGFDISYQVSGNQVKVNVLNNQKNGSFYSELSIYGIKPSYKFRQQEDYAYFKLAFKTISKIGFKKEYDKHFFQEFKSDVVDDYLTKVLHSFRLDENVIEKSIPLLDIKAPIAAVPGFHVDLTLSLDILASGRMELSFHTNNQIGYEYMNGNFRIINDFDKKLDSILNATTEATIGLGSGVSALGVRLADVKANFGVRATVDNKFYKIKEDSVESIDVDLPADYLSSAANYHEALKHCMILSANWVFKLKFNSSKTMLAKFKLSKEVNIFKDDFSIFKDKIYLENFHIVDKCQYDTKSVAQKVENVKDDRLELERYQKALFPNESIAIAFKQFPNKYTIKDLLFISENSNVAEVSQTGVIQAISSGSTNILIKTKDGKHTASFTILVKNNEN